MSKPRIIYLHVLALLSALAFSTLLESMKIPMPAQIRGEAGTYYLMALDLVDETPLLTAVAKVLAVIKKDSTYVFKGIQAAVFDGPCNDTSGFMLFNGVPAVGEGNQGRRDDRWYQ